MEARLTIITLGVANLAHSTAFYAKLGFKSSSASQDGVTFMQVGSLVLALFGRHELKADANAGEVWSGNGGITLAYNTRDEAEVNAVIDEAEAAGANILKRPERAFWGGYHGFFADLDGHVWEIAHNPFFEMTDEGAVKLPE